MLLLLLGIQKMVLANERDGFDIPKTGTYDVAHV